VVCSYLVSGADSSSLYVEVSEVNGSEVTTIAQNNAELEGLLTVFHMERSQDTLVNMQVLPPLISCGISTCRHCLQPG
jgi:pyruvate kinase